MEQGGGLLRRTRPPPSVLRGDAHPGILFSRPFTFLGAVPCRARLPNGISSFASANGVGAPAVATSILAPRTSLDTSPSPRPTVLIRADDAGRAHRSSRRTRRQIDNRMMDDVDSCAPASVSPNGTKTSHLRRHTRGTTSNVHGQRASTERRPKQHPHHDDASDSFSRGSSS